MEISVIIPAYNEEKNISSTLKEAVEYLERRFPGNWEIVIVDDGSQDSTRAVTEEFIDKQHAGSAGIRLLKNEKNSGKGAAVKKGMLAAKGEIRLFMDADGATKIKEIEKMLPFLNSGYEMVIGSRKMKASYIKEKQPFLRRFLSNIHHVIVNVVLGTRVSDYNCGFKCFNAHASEKLFTRQRIDGWVFDSEVIFLAKKYGIKAKEIAVEWAHRPTSKVHILRDMLNSLIGIMNIKLNNLKGSYN